MRRVIITWLFLTAASAGCGDTSHSDVAAVLDALPEQVPTTSANMMEPSTTTTTSQGACDDDDLATASLRPGVDALDAPTGSAVPAIRERGRLRVGVDENTLGFSWRNPRSGEIEGFEVDLATEIAARIFGGDAAGRVERVPVVTDEKFDVVEDGRVDMTISANSMTCRRWEQVAFSSEYYTAIQQFLVRGGSTIQSVADLAGKTVCVTSNSTSIDLLRRLVPNAELAPVRDRTGCLLAVLQEGQVNAYFGHDSFLYGMKRQDPTVEIRPLLPNEDTVSHYGIAIGEEHPDLVRFVNAVLEELRTDGTWADMHDQLEAEIDVPAADPPLARYRD